MAKQALDLELTGLEPAFDPVTAADKEATVEDATGDSFHRGFTTAMKDVMSEVSSSSMNPFVRFQN